MMINADDVAALKVEVHKLAIAIEELALKKYAQGEIDIGKLPWLTSNYVPGDSIKLSSSHLEKNVTRPQIECIMNDGDSTRVKVSHLSTSNLFNNHATPGAHHVFEEIPLPDFIREMAETVETERDNSVTSGSHDNHITLSTPQMFDDMCEPTSDLNNDQLAIHGNAPDEIELVQVGFMPTTSLEMNTEPWSSTLEDKGDFRGEEDKVYMEYTCQLFSILVFHHYHNSSRINKSLMFLISIFNPSGLSWPCELGDGHLNKFLPLSGLGLVLFADNVVIFVLNQHGSTTVWVFPFVFLPYSRFVIESLHSNLILALEGNVEYKRDRVYGVSSYNDAASVCLDEYIISESFIFGAGDVLTHCHIRLVSEFLLWSIFFPYYKFEAGEIKKEFIWDPGIIVKIAYEQFRTSNVSRVGCQKDIILLTLWLTKYLAVSSRISGVGAIGFVNFDCFASSMISNARALRPDNFKYVSTFFKMSEVLLLGTIGPWFITMRIMLVKELPRKDPTMSCKFSIFMIISSLVFDPGGWKYNMSLVQSVASKFLETAEIFLSCCLVQLNLMHSSDCVVHEVAILVFDPGGYGSYGDGHKVMEQPKACQNGGGKQLKDKRNEDHRIYVFDPGGPFRRLVIDDMVAVLQSGKYAVCLACCNYGLSLILEDKDRFKRRVLIHSKI